MSYLLVQYAVDLKIAAAKNIFPCCLSRCEFFIKYHFHFPTSTSQRIFITALHRGTCNCGQRAGAAVQLCSCALLCPNYAPCDRSCNLATVPSQLRAIEAVPASPACHSCGQQLSSRKWSHCMIIIQVCKTSYLKPKNLHTYSIPYT